MKWLVQTGIAPERLVSKGWGADRPLETNDTPEGRRNNRRVEFQVLDMDVNQDDANPGSTR
jgi:outer membrane protein OmpA-like peptidoglycan-associated protein